MPSRKLRPARKPRLRDFQGARHAKLLAAAGAFEYDTFSPVVSALALASHRAGAKHVVLYCDDDDLVKWFYPEHALPRRFARRVGQLEINWLQSRDCLPQALKADVLYIVGAIDKQTEIYRRVLVPLLARGSQVKVYYVTVKDSRVTQVR